MNGENQQDNYIKTLLENKPNAITGNSFYNVKLICQESMMDTNFCTCPKAEFEAKLIAKTIDTEIKSIKKQ